MAARKTYSIFEVEKALTTLVAYNGAARPASRALKAQGLQIGESLLRKWRDQSYPDRYAALKDTALDELRPLVVEEVKDTLAASREATLDAIRAAHEKIRLGEEKNPAGAASQLATAYEKIAKTDALLRGQPTEIVQTNGDDLIRQLDDFADKWGHVLEGEAVEVEPAQLASVNGNH